MGNVFKNFPVLLVEDDDNDVFLFKRAVAKAGLGNPIFRVHDGLEAMHYMTGEGKYSNRDHHPFPKIIICDLKMPRKTGLEFLEWMKGRPQLQVVPTIVLTSSAQDADVGRAYALGANTYFVKPGDFEGLQRLVEQIQSYWGSAMKPKREAESAPDNMDHEFQIMKCWK